MRLGVVTRIFLLLTRTAINLSNSGAGTTNSNIDR